MRRWRGRFEGGSVDVCGPNRTLLRGEGDEDCGGFEVVCPLSGETSKVGTAAYNKRVAEWAVCAQLRLWMM